jgi:hypothetical protein
LVARLPVETKKKTAKTVAKLKTKVAVSVA